MTREDRIKELKYAAQTIIDNAESIVGTEKTWYRLSVSIDINAGEVPTININKDIYPENLFTDGE